MANPKYSPEFKIEVAKAYLNGEGSYESIAKKYGVGHTSVEAWSLYFRLHGEQGFTHRTGNKTYTSDFKKQCIEAVLSGLYSVNEAVAKYEISSRTVLLDWIKRYNANRELKDYDPKREVYMAEARRKTTIEERKEIVNYCIEHGRNYKETAALYHVSYTQVYNWVRKYDADGEDALIDRRGHRKTDDEVDELERLRRENKRLKRQLEEKDMLVTLLKKVKEIEGK